MKILVVEDDDYKSTDICRVITETDCFADLTKAASVTSALRAVTQDRYDLLILDMSLPTFDLSRPGGGGSPQGQGGVEVLRLIRRMKWKPSVIVITQYPDIEIDGVEVPLVAASRRLSERFGIDVRACLAYEFDRAAWRAELVENLRMDGKSA